MTTNWQTATNFIGEKTDTAHNLGVEVFQKAKNSLSEIAVNANTAIDTIKTPTVNVLQQKTSQAVDSLTATSEKAKNAISQVSNQATNQITETTHQAKNTVLHAGKTLKDSVGDSLQKAESLSQIAVDQVQAAIHNQTQDWLNHHPIIHWLVSHPVSGLILLVIFIILMFGLFQAMGSLIKDAWLLILTSPFKFFQSSLKWSYQSVLKSEKSAQTSLSLNPNILSLSPVTPASISIEDQQRLAKIHQRLDEIHQEEHQLLEELKQIVGNC